MPVTIPPDAPRSEDGYYWWNQAGNDGEGSWDPVHPPEDAALGGARQHGAGPDGREHPGRSSVRLNLNDYPALWDLSQVNPSDDGVSQYLSHLLGVDVDTVSWESFQMDRDAFYSVVAAAASAAYEVVGEVTSAPAVTEGTVAAAADAMNRTALAGASVCDFLYSTGHEGASDRLREAMIEAQTEAVGLGHA